MIDSQLSRRPARCSLPLSLLLQDNSFRKVCRLGQIPSPSRRNRPRKLLEKFLLVGVPSPGILVSHFQSHMHYLSELVRHLAREGGRPWHFSRKDSTNCATDRWPLYKAHSAANFDSVCGCMGNIPPDAIPRLTGGHRYNRAQSKVDD